MGSRRSSAGPPIWDAALGHLARRPRSEAELRRHLLARGHDPAEVERTCARLVELGYLDDRRLALDVVTFGSTERAVGPARLLADLERRGVSRETAEEALRMAAERGDLAPELALRRRLARLLHGSPSLSPRAFARVYNALLRAGFDEQAILQELEPLRDSGSEDEPATDEASHDFP